ncbi:Ribosomal protein L4/L1e [Lasiodiplodia theobromae]|uniref:Ribosomal protein L4/L1e n=1 Tax=Lasiodiplodia theobromae TaxID=45133 RepID=UPI0015C3F864|nr:Ribosomal protein L4/L1e [Lasiodiplodia theobromae]KAF4546247.1 Ribosomal protein L4/L1e [Lasiodiplodia theobromae]
MASRGAARPLRGLVNSTTRNSLQGFRNASTPSITRSMATEAPLSASSTTAPAPAAPSTLLTTSAIPIANPKLYSPPIPEHIRAPTAPTTVYRFPTMEPLRFLAYPSSHLLVPLRRDLLHRAVVYEGDKTRQGTASTKWRSEVHGSGRKIRPQKGTGRARLGDKKSPMLRGGGVAFGPHPRDFATGLPRKIYDLAYRTALSYRYRRGELVVVEDGAELESASPLYLGDVFEANGWGNRNGRSLVITTKPRENLWAAMEEAGQHGEVKTWHDVDVKDALQFGRLIVEKSALDSLLETHQHDLQRPKVAVAQA